MSENKQSLGERMKSYENITRSHLIPRSYVLCRIDGRSFHSYTKNLKKPYDDGLMEDLDTTALFLCENIQNAKFAYVQSDEISFLLTDFENINTQQFFDGNIQKIDSIVASMASNKFNQLRISRQLNGRSMIQKDIDEFKFAEFDCRCWNVPCKIEAYNYFVWRNQDTIRNSINMIGQHYFSHKDLQKKSTADIKNMLLATHNIDYETTYSDSFKYGRVVYKTSKLPGIDNSDVLTNWNICSAWKFTNSDLLIAHIP
jgi:tRNA(His) 5'-end guanylyltransferase